MDGKKRDLSLDTFKGLCLALVIFLHLQGATGVGGLLSTWANPFKLVGFFVVSGFLLSKREKPVWETLGGLVQHRWRGIMIPYFTFSLIAIAVKVFVQTKTLSGATNYANIVIAQTFLLRGYSTLWFLPVLFICESAFLSSLCIEGWIHRRLGRRSVFVPVFFAVCAILASIYLSPVAKPLIHVPLNCQLAANAILPWLRSLPAFVCVGCGYYLYGPLRTFCNRHWVNKVLAASSLLASGLILSRFCGGIDWNNNVYGGNLLLFLASGLASSFGLMIAFDSMTRFFKFPVLSFIGINSLVLMATHLPLPVFDWARWLSSQASSHVAWLDNLLSVSENLRVFWLFSLVLLLEVPLVLAFGRTPLKVLLGKRLGAAA